MFHKWNDLGRQSLHRQGLGGFQRNEPWKKKFSVIIINNYDCDDHGMYCDHLEANLQLVSLLLLPVPAQVGHIPLDLSKFVMIMVMMMMMRIMMKMAISDDMMT